MMSMIRNSASVIALVLLLMISLYSISDATSNSATFGKYYSWLVFFNIVALILLTGLIFFNFYKLIRQYRLKQVGSRLTARMILIFIVLTIIPVSIVYYFSLTFIHRSIDSWFDVGIESALEDSLQLGKSALDVRKREAFKKTEKIVEGIPSVDENLLIVYLNDARSNLLMNELTLIGPNRSIIASSSVNSAELPTALSFSEVGEISIGNHYLALEKTPDTGLQIRVIIPVQASTTSTKPWQLHALFPLTDRINELTQGVERAYEQYKELAVLREPLKYSFTLALSIIWLLSVLSAIWMAFLSAKKLVAPINNLVEGTQAVAAGNYEMQVPLSGKDELGFLLRSFNTMTRKIARSRQQVEESQALELMQRAYLEAVLEHISSGVLTFDNELNIRKANTAAGDILGVDITRCSELSIAEIIDKYPALTSLLSEIESAMNANMNSWQKELVFFGVNGRKMLQLKGAAFSMDNSDYPGHVVVIDDLTNIIQAQKNSAWSDMARRLAHEIKNPLTPIQLSAERLHRKLSKNTDQNDQALLDRYTDTIVQQVEAMKVMVNSFTDYARSSETSKEANIDINEILKNVASLYEQQIPNLVLNLAKTLPKIQGDAVRIRQVMHNLLKNSIEATGDEQGVEVSSHVSNENGCQYIDIQFTDYGSGIKEEDVELLFEPYFTTKTSGTGLGLAIVKKIIEEHSGIVWAQNNAEHGATFTVRLPAMKSMVEKQLEKTDEP